MPLKACCGSSFIDIGHLGRNTYVWSAKKPMKSSTLGSILLSLAAAIWGSMYVVSKIVLRTIPPLTLVWMRYVIALAILLGIMAVARISWRLDRRDFGRVLQIGLIGYVVSIAAQFIGTKLATAQLGSLITASTPAFMILFAYVILRERINTSKLIALCLAAMGVLLIVGLGHQAGSVRLGEVILGIAAVSWAWMSVLVKTVPQRYSILTVTFYSMLVATALMTPIAFWQMGIHRMLTVFTQEPRLDGYVLYLGVVATAAAFFMWNAGLQRVQAGVAGFYLFFQPVVGGVLGWLLLNEHFTWSLGLGAAVIVLAVVLALKGGGGRAQTKPHGSTD